MGFSRKLSSSELQGIPGRTFYLPYHIVEHPYKPDKPRLVFNASYRQNGQSLNDVLHTRPDLITPLSTVLIRYYKKLQITSTVNRQMIFSDSVFFQGVVKLFSHISMLSNFVNKNTR